MIKKSVLIFTLIVFISFTFSCTSIKKIRVHGPRTEKISTAKIITVYTKSKQLFEFPTERPAKIVGDKIVGNTVDKSGNRMEVSIPLWDAKVIWVKKTHTELIILTPFAIIGGLFSILMGTALVFSG
jgi:hypothetical protein